MFSSNFWNLWKTRKFTISWKSEIWKNWGFLKFWNLQKFSKISRIYEKWRNFKFPHLCGGFWKFRGFEHVDPQKFTEISRKCAKMAFLCTPWENGFHPQRTPNLAQKSGKSRKFWDFGGSLGMEAIFPGGAKKPDFGPDFRDLGREFGGFWDLWGWKPFSQKVSKSAIFADFADFPKSGGVQKKNGRNAKVRAQI